MPGSKSILFLLVFDLLFHTSTSFAVQWDDLIYTESSDSITKTDYTGSGSAVVILKTIGGKTETAIVLSNPSFAAGTTNWWWLNTYSAPCGFPMQPGGL
jgi:hypothetical protein